MKATSSAAPKPAAANTISPIPTPATLGASLATGGTPANSFAIHPTEVMTGNLFTPALDEMQVVVPVPPVDDPASSPPAPLVDPTMMPILSYMSNLAGVQGTYLCEQPGVQGIYDAPAHYVENCEGAAGANQVHSAAVLNPSTFVHGLAASHPAGPSLQPSNLQDFFGFGGQEPAVAPIASGTALPAFPFAPVAQHPLPVTARISKPGAVSLIDKMRSHDSTITNCFASFDSSKERDLHENTATFSSPMPVIRKLFHDSPTAPNVDNAASFIYGAAYETTSPRYLQALNSGAPAAHADVRNDVPAATDNRFPQQHDLQNPGVFGNGFQADLLVGPSSQPYGLYANNVAVPYPKYPESVSAVAAGNTARTSLPKSYWNTVLLTQPQLPGPAKKAPRRGGAHAKKHHCPICSRKFVSKSYVKVSPLRHSASDSSFFFHPTTPRD